MEPRNEAANQFMAERRFAAESKGGAPLFVSLRTFAQKTAFPLQFAHAFLLPLSAHCPSIKGSKGSLWKDPLEIQRLDGSDERIGKSRL